MAKFWLKRLKIVGFGKGDCIYGLINNVEIR